MMIAAVAGTVAVASLLNLAISLHHRAQRHNANDDATTTAIK